MSDPNYQSLYGSTRPVTPAAYLAEIIVKRQSGWSKIVLPERFWNDSAYTLWTSKWRCQMRFAAGLLKSGFTPECIVAVITKNDNIGTLNNKRLYPLLCEHQRKLENEAKIEYTKIETVPTDSKPQPQPDKGNLSKRNRLD